MFQHFRSVAMLNFFLKFDRWT